ncbi:MAG: ABC transporter ATP-binding protein [bacterium]
MIEISDLKKIFHESSLIPLRRGRRIVALDGVNLRVNSGEVVALVGRNGAGKTTLLKILTTLVLPTSGKARIDGTDVVSEPDRVRALAGFATGDERSFYWRLTGRQNLELFAALYNLPTRLIRSRVEELSHTLGFSSYADQTFKSYSTGMRQRLALARSLIHNPLVLLLDEPTHGLDPVMKSQLLNFIRDELVRSAGKTILFATHQLSDATEIADRIAVIDRGRIIAELPSQEADDAKKILLETESNALL